MTAATPAVRRLWARLKAWRWEAFGDRPLPEDGPGFRTVKLPPIDDTEGNPR